MDQDEKTARVKKAFDTVAEAYDQSSMSWFDRTADAIAQASELGANQSALDIATGTGKVALRLAATSPGVTVLGVDLSEKMLEQAKKKAASAQLSNVQFEQCAFDEMNFGEKFDLVTCSFGLFFVDDMAEMLKHFAAQAAPQGRIIISTFALGAFSPFTDAFYRLFGEFGFDSAPPRWVRLATPELLSGVFEEAGLNAPRCTAHDFGFELASADEWWGIIWSAGFRGMLQMMSDEQVVRFKEKHLQEVEGLLKDGQTRLDVRVIIGVSDKKS